MSGRETAAVAKLGRDVAILTICTGLLMSAGLGWLAVNGRVAAWPIVPVAGGVCWLGVVGGLAVMALANRSGNGIAGVLAGMLIRFGLPLGVGIGLSQSRHWLGEQGVFGLILVNYLVLLPIETWLSLSYVQPATVQSATGQSAASKKA